MSQQKANSSTGGHEAAPKARVSEFEREAAAARSGIVGEFWQFLKHNKKWWLLPILISIVLVAALVVLGGSGVAPFIYTLF